MSLIPITYTPQDESDWHDLEAYEMPQGYPRIAKPFNRRAAIHVNESSTVYSYSKYATDAEAEQAARDKITELKQGE